MTLTHRLARVLANGSTALLGAPRRWQQSAATRRIEAVQRAYLLDLLRRNAGTCFGRRHGFAGIRSVAEYTRRVPLANYEDFASHIAAIARGERDVLTADPVELFEPTSGTSAGTKLIPYTRGLKADFRRGVGAWLASLYSTRPELLDGRAYWSISPALDRPARHGAIRVGFDDDSEYLGFLGRRLYDLVAAVPYRQVRHLEGDRFRESTLAHLLLAEDLRLVSIWSPTFLTGLLEHLFRRPDQVLGVLASSGLPDARVRARRVARVLEGDAPAPRKLTRIWPRLRLVSCWTHGPSAVPARRLADLLDGIRLQPKGLIATEALVSLPLLRGRDPVLAATCHFFEFIERPGRAVRLAHELEVGGRYSVVVTTSGGLYRYRLGDLVEVTGFAGEAPTMRFVAREGAISSLAGEKLSAEHVQRSVEEMLAGRGISPGFFLLAPSGEDDDTAYTLYVELEQPAQRAAAELASELDRRLAENFHYATCRKIGQLAQPSIFAIDRSTLAPEVAYSEEMQRRGIRLGDIKPAVLDDRGGWDRRFTGGYR